MSTAPSDFKEFLRRFHVRGSGSNRSGQSKAARIDESRFNAALRQLGVTIGRERRMILAFSPALVLFGFGVAIIVAPKLVLTVIAAFCMTLALFVSFVIWKVIQMKRRFESIVAGLEGKMVTGRFVVQPNVVQANERARQESAGSQNTGDSAGNSSNNSTRASQLHAEIIDQKKIIVH